MAAQGPALGEHSAAATIQHTWDFASTLPSRLAIMFSMSWFGIPSSDPQGAGPDSSWGNWQWGGGCIATNNPATCDASGQRAIASNRRPLAGIYSSSARNTEGLRRVDLMLSNLRRPCDDGARLDAWAVQIDSIRDTSRYPSNPQSTKADLAYRAMLAFFSEADNAGMTNAVMPGDDPTWYFHFGSSVGLGACNDSTGNPRQSCLDALQADIVDMVNIANQHASAVKVNGKPVLLFYVDAASPNPSASEWQTIFNNARNLTGSDFYTVGTTENAMFFNAFDALAPWVNLGQWNSTSGATIYAHASAWVAAEHSSLFGSVSQYPGRIVFGGVAPGFDDYTKDWGACTVRQIPRDPNVLQAEFDYLKSKSVHGVVLETWDDWTEGSEFEPDVANGANTLVQLRQLLGSLNGDPSDPAGDTRLSNRWTGYGQARNCSGGSAGTPPQTVLTCSSGGTVSGTVTNVQTGGAVSGATVSVGSLSTTSDASGHYTLLNVPAGNQTLSAAAPGYLTRSYSITVTAGQTTTLNAQISTSGKIVGNVTHNSAAVAGASVNIQGGQIATNKTVTTDSTGHYDEGWVPLGTYTVTCSASGLATQTVSNVVVNNGATTTVNCSI